MAVTKLRLYQDALRHLADARLALITDDVESRYALDDAWDEAVAFVLRLAPWRFAMKTAVMGTTTGPLPGFAQAYGRPADWMRTHAIFQVSTNGRECPLDIREQGLKFSANPIVSFAIQIRYISSDYADPALALNPWPENFAQLVAAYLAFLVAERVTGERSAAGRMSELFSSILEAAIAIDAAPEDSWLPYQLDGTFRRVAEEIARLHFWRFFMVSAEVQTTAAAGLPGGFDRQASMPGAWWRTRALYVLTDDGQRRPLDIREQGGVWYTDKASFWAEYMSSTLVLNSMAWTAQFMRAVQMALPIARGATKSTETDVALAQAAIVAAVEVDTDLPDPWLVHQLDGTFDRAAEAVIMRGFWTKHMKTLQIDVSALLVDPAMAGLPYRYALPADHLRTHALYVPRDGLEAPLNIRESAEDWSTDSPLFAVRYLSTDALDSTNWPAPVAKAVLAYLDWQSEPASAEADKAAPVRAPAYQKLLLDALDLYSQPPSRWLRYQLDGSFQPAVWQVLEKARWRFAIRTIDLTENTDPTAISDGTVSTGYAYRFLKPNDHLRTIWVHYDPYGDRDDIDFRDERDAIHADYSPIKLRYLTRAGLDATRWTANFSDAVLALLEYLEIRADPTKAAAAKAKLDFYERQCSLAETLDDMTEVPRVNNGSWFVAARYGRRGHGGAGGGFAGTATPSSTTILTGDGDDVLTAG